MKSVSNAVLVLSLLVILTSLFVNAASDLYHAMFLRDSVQTFYVSETDVTCIQLNTPGAKSLSCLPGDRIKE